MSSIDRVYATMLKEVVRQMKEDKFDTSYYVMTPEDFAEKYGDRPRLRQLELGRGVKLLSAILDKGGSVKEQDNVESYIYIVFESKDNRLDYLKAKDVFKIKELEKKYKGYLFSDMVNK